MASPFPGMDPWLEDPRVFGGLHFRLMGLAADLLQPQLLSRGYYIDANERIWVEESARDIMPDDAIVQWRASTTPQAVTVEQSDKPIRVRTAATEYRQPYLEIFDAEHRKLVTGIEFVSPTNKLASKGRKLYRKKQRELQAAGVNLVEVDLLRKGRPILAVPPALADDLKPWDYLVSVWRAAEEDGYELYPISVRTRLPRILIPLNRGDEDAVLDLQMAMTKAYDAAPYSVRINYRQPPRIPLSPEDQAWAEQLLIGAGLRSD
jgi:hypothetical protein